MDRRTFNKLTGLAAIGALTGTADVDAEPTTADRNGAAMSGEHSTSADEVVLQDETLLVAFDAGSGALTRLKGKETQWTIERRPELGISFRLFAPLPHHRDNFVLGQKQRALQVEKISDHQVRLQWKNLISERGGTLPMTFTATVTLENGTLTFDSELINDSPLVVETIDYPYLGDLSAPDAPTSDATMDFRAPFYGDLSSDEIYPTFSNELGYWGDDFPTKIGGVLAALKVNSLFSLIQAPQEGLYVELHDPNPRYLLQYVFEQHPGVLDSIHNSVPREDEIAGKPDDFDNLVPRQDVVGGRTPVHLEFRTCHFVFAHPHTTYRLMPIALRAYRGDWHAGVDLYKQWRATWFQPPHFPAWVKDVNAWQQLQVNSPEEEFRIPYRDLIQYGEEDAANGVTAIQLVGWNHGGQDGGNPSLDTDPGLGTWQQLHDAIAQIQAKGVHIVLFAKFLWADITTAWYKNELYKYAATDPYGIPYQAGGYSYHTPTQLAGINNHRFAIMDQVSPAYRDIAAHEFHKILALGATGWLYDEVCHTGAAYNFSPNHGYTAPGFIAAGQIPLATQLQTAANKVNPDFLSAGEGPEDWLRQYYMSYIRITAKSTPVDRYIDPQSPIMVAVTGFDDREMLNLILLNRYIISYEPYNFKGHVTDFPLTLAYGKKIDALRRKYKAWLWDAEFRDTLGAKVTADGTHRYSVFVTPAGKRAVIVANEETKKAITATVQLPHPGRLVVATPEQPDALPTSGTLQVPARSAAVVMES